MCEVLIQGASELQQSAFLKVMSSQWVPLVCVPVPDHFIHNKGND